MYALLRDVRYAVISIICRHSKKTITIAYFYLKLIKSNMHHKRYNSLRRI